MAKEIRRNVKLIADYAEGSGQIDGFNIYIDFSGNREYLMFHRSNGRLFSLLKLGISISELERSIPKVVSKTSLSGRRYSKGGTNKRLKCRKNESRKIENTIEHVVTVANDYLEEIDYAVA